MIVPSLVVAAALAALLAGCAAPEPQSHAAAVNAAVCRQRADQVYALRNRDQVYKDDTYATSARDAPLSTSGTIGVTSRGLSARYERDQILSDCLAGTGSSVGATPAAPPPEKP